MGQAGRRRRGRNDCEKLGRHGLEAVVSRRRNQVVQAPCHDWAYCELADLDAQNKTKPSRASQASVVIFEKRQFGCGRPRALGRLTDLLAVPVPRHADHHVGRSDINSVNQQGASLPSSLASRTAVLQRSGQSSHMQKHEASPRIARQGCVSPENLRSPLEGHQPVDLFNRLCRALGIQTFG